MEIITLSGKVTGICECRKDKNGNKYIRFKVCCVGKDYGGDVKYTVYRCFCYDTNFNDLQNGDTVFLCGDLNMSIKDDISGRPALNCDVYVKCISRGDS